MIVSGLGCQESPAFTFLSAEAADLGESGGDVFDPVFHLPMRDAAVQRDLAAFDFDRDVDGIADLYRRAEVQGLRDVDRARPGQPGAEHR